MAGSNPLSDAIAVIGKSAALPELFFRAVTEPADGNGNQIAEFAIGETGLTLFLALRSTRFFVLRLTGVRIRCGCECQPTMVKITRARMAQVLA